MSRSKMIAIAVLGLAAVNGIALAQSTLPPSGGGRFSMHPADGGMLRLDGETGTMSMCKSQSGGQWACQALPDERAALDKEIARLAQENRDLQASVKRLEDLNGIPSDKPQKRADRGLGNVPLPGPEDVDKAMSYLHGMVKKFKEKLKEFEDLEGKRTEKL